MDLDVTVIMQLVIIMAALAAGAGILARPFLRAILEREALIEGARGKAALLEQEAKQLSDKSAAILEEKLQEMNSARQNEIVLTRGELQTGRQALQEAHIKRLEEADKELAAYAAKTKASLATDHSNLADLLVNSLSSQEGEAA